MGEPGRLGCLSFHPRKIVTTGEGGAVTTNDPEIADAIRRFRHHGIEPRGDFEIRAAGLNYRLAGHPLRDRDDPDEPARGAARRARAPGGRVRGAARLGGRAPSADEGDRHGWQAYVVRTEERDGALEALAAAGIQAQIGTYALHRLAAYADKALPRRGRGVHGALALPFHNRLTQGGSRPGRRGLDRLVSE